jgi:methionine-rich copper-binding protein CopC
MRKLIVSIVIGFTALLMIPSSVAHVEIVSTFPEQFANVNPIPTQAWIQFSEDLQTLEGEAVNSLEVIDSTGIAVNFDDPVIEGAKIMTKISGQSAPGVFTVRYRVVGQDGHVIEGDYTFNASPDYAEAVPISTTSMPTESSIPVGGILLAFLLATFFGGIYMRAKGRRD